MTMTNMINDHLKKKKLESRHMYLVNDVDDQTHNYCTSK